MPKALFIDRDGILNEAVIRQGLVHSPRNLNEVRLCPEVAEITRVKSLGFELILISNQPDIERGLVTGEFIETYHRSLQQRFQLDALYVCPFSSPEHPLKKPNPGMFFQAAQERNLDLRQSFHLGDTEKDTLAAARAGVRSILWERPYNQNLAADYRVANIDQLLRILAAKR